jgi:hypothetical protein
MNGGIETQKFGQVGNVFHCNDAVCILG